MTRKFHPDRQGAFARLLICFLTVRVLFTFFHAWFFPDNAYLARKSSAVSKSKKIQQKRRAVHSKEKNVMQLDGEKTLYAKMKDKAITMFLVMALSFRLI